MHSRRFSLAAAAVAAALVAGCGSAEEPQEAVQNFEHGVFVSTSDCANSGKATMDQCGSAIDAAVASHIATAPVHPSLYRCEAAEGPERCEKIGQDQYRARVQAFFVTFSDPPTALPLYPPSTPVAGFNSPSKQQLSVLNETLNMSLAAIAIANDNSRLPEGNAEASAQLGEDATNIH